MSDQDDVAELFPSHEVGDISDVGVEAYVMAQEMRTFSKTDERRRKHPVPFGCQQAAHASPAPTAMERAVDQNVIGHCGVLLVIYPRKTASRAG
jgi:hypothetical protein